MNMMFFNTRQPTTMNGRMPLVNRNSGFQNSNVYQPIGRTQQQALVHQTTQEPLVPKTDMKWGAPTWFLLHTIAEKVKENHFMSIRGKLFELIQIICANLPCPKCSGHAVEYMKKINFNSIMSKRDLQLLLFNFHNEVNARKNLPIFELQELSQKYSAANTVNIIHNFFHFFKDKSTNVNMISLNLYRERIIKDLQKWFQENLSYFEL
jgi:hypothetical protein